MPRVSAVFIDLSGTLHVDTDPLPNAVSALRRLRHECPGLTIRFVTNTTKESLSSLLHKLSHIGFDIPQEKLFTSLSAAKKIVVRSGVRPLLFLENEALEDFAGIDCSNPNAVVIGLAPSQFNYEKLNEAYHILRANPTAPFIAIHKSPIYIPTLHPPTPHLGPGPFIALLESATGTSSTLVGKPSPVFFSEAIRNCGMLGKEEEVWMVGDDIIADVSGIKGVGGKSILVKTGKYQENDEIKLKDKSLRPDMVVSGFAEAVDRIVEMWKEDH